MLLWNDNFSIGIEGIDLQHRYFIDLLNRLSLELKDSDAAYQAKLIDELASYAKQHFISEENIMYKLGYPGLKKHSEYHQELLEKLNGRIGLYLLDMLEPDEIISYLSKWLIQHIVQEDKVLAKFIAKAKSV